MFIVNKNTAEIARKQMMLSYKKCYLAAVKAVLSFYKEAKTEERKRHWKEELEKLKQDYAKVKARENI